jgi:hypothetical protein
MSRVVILEIWLAKILVDILLVHELINIGYKNEVELALGSGALACQKIGSHPNTHQLFDPSQQIARYSFVTIQAHP